MKPDEVKALLDRSYAKDGTPGAVKNKISNYATILLNDDRFLSLVFDSFKQRPVKVEKDGTYAEWTDNDDATAQMYIEDIYGIQNDSKYGDAFRVMTMDENRCFNFLQDRLKSIPWDGKPHCEKFLSKWLLCDDTAYTAEVSRLIFAGGINRAFIPGCKFDAVPVLQGSQGCGKSQIVRWLGFEEYSAATDTIDGKDGLMVIDGKLIVELEELTATIAATPSAAFRKELSIKGFITRQEDRYRRPFDVRPCDHPRTCIFIGTTNETQFLSDKTGSRRWFPVICKRQENDPFVGSHAEEIQADIAQCWAEMYHAFINHKPIASPYPRHDLLDEIKAAQSKAEMEDPWVGLITAWLEGETDTIERLECCSLQIAVEALGFEKTKVTQGNISKINKILRHTLKWQPMSNSKYFPLYGSRRGFYNPQKMSDPTLK